MHKFDSVGETVRNSYLFPADMLNCNHYFGGQFDCASKKWWMYLPSDIAILLLGNYSIAVPAPIVIIHYNNSTIIIRLVKIQKP